MTSSTEDITPFQVRIPETDVTDLRERLRRTRWPEPETVGDWSQGTPLAYVRELCRYWREDYDWDAAEARLNRFPQFRTGLGELRVHFVHVRSPHPDAVPLLMTHGWPGSVTEFSKVIDQLADPSEGIAFHVVCPSLPGFGFSEKPSQPGWGTARIADAWDTLMNRLGYPRYVAQGGDWGARIAMALGRQHPESLIGIHLNMVPFPNPTAPRTSRTPNGQPSTRWPGIASRDPRTPRFKRRAPRASATGWPTRPPRSPPGSPRSSRRGVTAPAIPAPSSPATSFWTTSCCTGFPPPERRPLASTGKVSLPPVRIRDRFRSRPAARSFLRTSTGPLAVSRSPSSPTCATGTNSTGAGTSPRLSSPPRSSRRYAPQSGGSAERGLDPHAASGGTVVGVEEHLTVGRVAELSGVTVRALHHCRGRHRLL